MSIFKVKQWWSSEQGDHSIEGLQNAGCLKVDRFNTHVESDCVLVGENSMLKIYKPSTESTQALVEIKLNDSILQVETGKFIAGTENRQILILHPQNYTVYDFSRKEGHIDAGDQNLLLQLVKHSFTRKAYSLTCGPFGGIKTRDLICVQGLDGSLSFFDQNTFLFICTFDDVIIPGPVSYVASSDCFVICKSTWILEIYSYQQLRETSELTARQNNKNIPQWVYNAGEEVSSIQVIKTSNNISSIIALSERHLCCFQDNGLLKFMLKFDFMPICFYAYLIGWYYEPGARLLIMVASDDSKVYIYEGSSLLWACDILQPAIALSRCFVKDLSGGLVTMTSTGVISVGYFGTEPNLNPNVPVLKEKLDAEEIQKELEATEELLKNVMDNTEDTFDQGIDDIIKIKADIGKPVVRESEDITNNKSTMSCPVVVVITCNDPKLIQNIQITYDCKLPFACSDKTISLDNINGTEIVETRVSLDKEAIISDSSITILVTVIRADGKITILTYNIQMPLSFYFAPCKSSNENKVKIIVETNQSGIKFEDIFTDYSTEELSSRKVDEITFENRVTNSAVTVKNLKQDYSIETNDFSEVTAILHYFIIKLSDHFHRMSVKNLKVKFKLDEDFVKQLLHKFLKSIEAHAKDRSDLKRFEEHLNVLQRQFTTVQKRLLVQYGSLPPGDCEPLEFLMNDTHQRIIQTVDDIMRCRENTIKTGCVLSAVGNLIIYILKQNSVDGFKVKLIEEMMSFGSLYDLHQEWQESVIQSLPYILDVFNKSEKDKEKLAPVTEQGLLSHINMKRFLKQIRLILEKMFNELTETKPREKVTRIEELVDVI